MKITEIDASMEPFIAGRPGRWQIFVEDMVLHNKRGRERVFVSLDAAVNALARVGVTCSTVFYDADAA